MTLKRVGGLILVLLIVLAIAMLALAWHPAMEATDKESEMTAEPEMVEKGYELAQIGNCASCHTDEGGEPYAGGKPLDTPFGTLYSSNITPDRETGIGQWSQEAFARAMREGVDRKGHNLYPAFPYDHFSHADDDDIHALYVYLNSVSPVNREKPDNDLSFPFNMRFLLAGWNLLFLDGGPIEPNDEESEQWNRGHYLTESLAHCSACHTPRNAFGAEKSSQPYAGAVIDGWYAPPLQGDKARPWGQEQLKEYLTTGFSEDHGAAAGPMAETVNNLSEASSDDVEAIAHYVASLTPDADGSAEAIDHGEEGTSERARELWQGSCARCHEARGERKPSSALSLETSGVLRQDQPHSTIQTILNGMDAYRDKGGPYMPAFRDVMSDEDIEALARYLRKRYTDEQPWQDLDQQVPDARDASRSKD